MDIKKYFKSIVTDGENTSELTLGENGHMELAFKKEKHECNCDGNCNCKKKKKRRGFEVVRDDCRKFPDKEIKLPTRGTARAMAYDFYAPTNYTVEPGKVVKVWTDVKAYMRDDEALILNVRSSMGGKFMLSNTSGWVDSDYYNNEDNDGRIGVFLLNISDEVQEIHEGDRIAQGYFTKYLVADDGNTEEERKGGFGSTNK